MPEIILKTDMPDKAASINHKSPITLYDDLRRNRGNLGILPQKWLEYLDEVIAAHENC